MYPKSSDIKATVREHWGARAESFDLTPGHSTDDESQRARWISQLREWLPDSGSDVLDVGCGTGFLSLLMAELELCVTGIDLSPSMIEVARRKASVAGELVSFLVDDAESPRFPPRSFDVIVGRHLVWTLPSPRRAVDAWFRLLRPGGRAVLIEGAWGDHRLSPAYEEIRDGLPMYGGARPGPLRQMLIEGGWADVQVKDLGSSGLWGSSDQRQRFVLLAQRPNKA